MTPVPFFLVPLALASGFVLGWLVSWMRGSETRRRLRDARIVFANFVSGPFSHAEDGLEQTADFVLDMHRALSGKERK